MHFEKQGEYKKFGRAEHRPKLTEILARGADVPIEITPASNC